MHEIRESRIPGVIDIVLYNKSICNYIIYDISIKLHKTRRRSLCLFSIYTFENSGCGWAGGPSGQHKY